MRRGYGASEVSVPERLWEIIVKLVLAGALSFTIASAAPLLVQPAHADASSATGVARPASPSEGVWANRWNAEISCYYERLNRTGAYGPRRFVGTGNSRQAAIGDARAKANAAAPSGFKLKHCRTVRVTNRK